LPISAPEITVESIIQTGFAKLLASNAGYADTNWTITLVGAVGSGTSSTSFTIPAVGASTTLVTQTGLSFTAAQTVLISSANNPYKSFQGTITSYNSGTGNLVVACVYNIGALYQLPLIFTDFPIAYINETISYLQDPDFKANTYFSYYFDPAQMPAFNIVLANEAESPSDRQMYLNDRVESAAQIPNTQPNESFGSDWTCSVTVIIRTEKMRQCIVLYNILKWMFLKNRQTFEAAGIKTTRFSGSDIMYSSQDAPTFIFNRKIQVDCRIYNTVDYPVTGPTATTITSVVASFPSEVTDLDIENEVLGSAGTTGPLA